MRRLTLVGTLVALAFALSSTSASATTWDGSCTMKGTVHIQDPFTLVPEIRRWYSEASGTCTGTLDGAHYDGPASFYIEGRMGKPMSCEAGVSKDAPTYLYFGGSRYDLDATVLDMYNVASHVFSFAPIYLYGAYNGHAVGTMITDGSPEQLQQCAGAGSTEAHYDFNFRTLTRLYG